MFKKNIFYLLFIELIPIFFTVFAVCIAYLNQSFMGIFNNSDILCIADIFKDLSNGAHLRDWVIPTTGMFFPDWIIFWIAFISTKNIYYQLLIMACINTLMMYLMVRIMYGQFFGRKKAILYSYASIGMMFFFIFKNLEPFIFLLVPGQHVGGFIIGLLYLYLQIRLLDNYSKKNKNVFIFAIYTISLAMGASDLLFIIQFLIPIFLAYLYLYLNKKIKLSSLFVISIIPIFLSLLSVEMLQYVNPRNKLWDFVKHSTINSSIIEIYKNKIYFIIHCFSSIMHFGWPLFVYLIFFSLITIVHFINIINRKNKLYITNVNFFINLFILFSIIITTSTFILFTNDPAIRYLEPLFFFPILIFFFLDSFFFTIKAISSTFEISAYIIFSIFLLTQSVRLSRQIYTIKSNFYPNELACIDRALIGHDRHGVANYWTARPISLFSHEHLYINEIFNNLTPFKLATNAVKVSSRNTYSFVIINTIPNIPPPNAIELDEKYVESINGLPKKVVICGNKKLLIYPKDTFRVAVFVTKGDQYTWPAARLPSLFPKSVDLQKRTVKAADGPGYVTFGPYVTLSAGRYKVVISYSSKAAINKKIGYWDISSNNTGQVLKFDLFGTDNNKRQLNANFTVIREIKENSYEFRIYSFGKSNVNLDEIKLIKVTR